MEAPKKEDTLKKALWELGLTDRQIASVFKVEMYTISDWRANLGLDRNQGLEDILNKKSSEDTLKKALWELGLTDPQIADVFFVKKFAIAEWRRKNGLESKYNRKGSHLEKEEEEFRLKLWDENYSDEEIANATGLKKQSVIFWRMRRNLFKDKRNSEKIEELSEKESIFLEYLKSKYPERSDAFCIGLAKYIEPKVGGTPTIQQREFVRKIKAAGFKTIHYFNDGEYTNLNEAMDLFIKSNPNIDENISKLQAGISRELYQVFLKRRDFDTQGTQIDADEKISTSIALDPEPIKTIDNDLDTGGTQINPDEKISTSVVLDPESIKIIDMDRGQQSRSAFINELIHAYGNGQE
jgi:hypothetical protein